MDFVIDIFDSKLAKERPYFNSQQILKGLNKESKFGRKIWGLLSLELWHREFHDKQSDYKKIFKEQKSIVSNQKTETINN